MDQSDRAEDRRDLEEPPVTDVPGPATVIPFPQGVDLRSNMLREAVETFCHDRNLPLTSNARDFLREVVRSVMSDIPAEADFFLFKKRIAEMAEMVFRILAAAGMLGVPQNLPKREKPIADSVILRTSSGFIPSKPNTAGAQAAEESRKKSKFPRIEGLILKTRLLLESLRFRLGLLTPNEIFVKPTRLEEIRFQLELVLADCLFLDKTFEREGGRFPNASERGRAFLIEKELDRVAELLERAEATAQKLRDEKPAAKKTLIKGARIYAALNRAEQVAADYEYARGKAHLMMVQESSDMKTPRILRTHVPTHVDKQVVIDVVAQGDRRDALRRGIALVQRQIKTPVPFDALTSRLFEWSAEKPPYPGDIDPVTAIHEIVRRVTGDAGCSRPEILQRDLMQVVFEDGRPLLTRFEPWRPN